MRFSPSPHIEKVHFPPISEVKNWIAGRVFPAEKPLVDLCQAVPDYAKSPWSISARRCPIMPRRPS